MHYTETILAIQVVSKVGSALVAARKWHGLLAVCAQHELAAAAALPRPEFVTGHARLDTITTQTSPASDSPI